MRAVRRAGYPGAGVGRAERRCGRGIPCQRGTLALLVLFSTLAGCATDPEQLAQERAERVERTWVLLTPTQWDAKIVPSLREAGFAVTPKNEPSPDARYGLTVTVGERVDYCLLNDSDKLARVTYEVTDLQTKKVVLTETRSGWTGPCFVQWTEVFDELAEAIRSDWSNRRR